MQKADSRSKGKTKCKERKAKAATAESPASNMHKATGYSKANV